MSNSKKKPRRIAKPEPPKKVPEFVRKELKARTEGQKRLLEAIAHNQVTLVSGPSGVGKTLLSIGYAVQQVVYGQYEKIVLSRPIIPAGGEDMGALPGTAEEKIHPYLIPLFDSMKYFLSHTEIATWRNEKKYEICPIALMRGRTFHNAIIITDESQNATLEQLIMVLTRIGTGSKMILNGDVDQSDLKYRDRGGFQYCLDKLIDTPDVSVVQMGSSDIVRNPIIGTILAKLDNTNRVRAGY